MSRFNGVSLITDDVAGLTEFYGECFGVPVERLGDFAWVQLPGATLSIFTSTGMADMAPGWQGDAGHRSMTLEIEVDDVEATLARANALDVTVVKPVTTQPWGRTSAWFQDPDQNLINIFQCTPAVDPEAVVREYFRRLFTERDLSVCTTSLSPGYIDHDAPEGTSLGPDATAAYVARMHRDDPYLTVEVLATVSHGRTVAAHVRWTPGAGRAEPRRDGLILIDIDEQNRLRERTSAYW